jgi:hypothetical protein
MKINSRRKGSTFLDYQYGEVVPVDEDNQYQDKIEGEPVPVKEEFEIKGKKIKARPLYVVISLLFGLFICYYLLMHSYTSITLTAKVFNFLGDSYITASAYNNNYIKEKEEELAEKGSSSLNIFDFEGQKEYNKKKDTAKHLMTQISTYDKYLLSYYNSLKTNINQYRSGKSSYYIMNSSLESLTNTATYDYNKLLSEPFPDENIKKLFVARYKIFLSYLSSQTNSFTPSSLVTKTNETIAEDNAYNLKEYEFLKQYLDSANISYICENNKIRVV